MEVVPDAWNLKKKMTDIENYAVESIERLATSQKLS